MHGCKCFVSVGNDCPCMDVNALVQYEINCALLEIAMHGCKLLSMVGNNWL